MICQVCKNNNATVHITELPVTPPGVDEQIVVDKHICTVCAGQMNLPHMQMPSKNSFDIWKLLQISGNSSGQEPKLTCPECGMTLAEFRSKGRLGCPNDYELFRPHLDSLLLRMHNANQHVGHVEPEVEEEPEGENQRDQQISTLLERLELAIRDEAYEAAAELRDELKTLKES
ncbi:MAG: protein arginine kinase activator [Planctomycetota bacterium]|jgi:protein arginine kinase activator